MAKDPKRTIQNDDPAFTEIPYEKLVSELDGVVQKLEGGELTLEDSLKAFERGVKLAQAAEARLDAAEQRVEVLLQGDKTAPLPPLGTEASESPRGAATGRRMDDSAARATSRDAATSREPAMNREDDDIPF